MKEFKYINIDNDVNVNRTVVSNDYYEKKKKLIGSSNFNLDTHFKLTSQILELRKEVARRLLSNKEIDHNQQTMLYELMDYYNDQLKQLLCL